MLYIFLFYGAIPWHNFKMWRMATTLDLFVSHPSTSHLVEKKAFFGSRYITHSECTFTVGEIRSTSQTYSKILNNYRSKSTQFFSFAPNMTIHLAIIDKKTSLSSDEPASKWIDEYLDRKINKSSNTYYIVYLYDPGQVWWGDDRCYE